MAYKPKKFTRYVPGMALRADDLNEAFRRLERLENASCQSPLHIGETPTGRHFSLSTPIPEIEFARISDALNCDSNQVVEGFVLDYDQDSDAYIDTEAPITLRNIFKHTTDEEHAEAIVFAIRFPRGRGEWMICFVEQVCEE